MNFLLLFLALFTTDVAKKTAPKKWFTHDKGGPAQGILFYETRIEHAQSDAIDPDNDRIASMVGRYEDREKGVTCWVVWGYTRSDGLGISCLPNSMLRQGNKPLALVE